MANNHLNDVIQSFGVVVDFFFVYEAEVLQNGVLQLDEIFFTFVYIRVHDLLQHIVTNHRLENDLGLWVILKRQ